MESSTNEELKRYDATVAQLVASARRKFIKNQERGKFGWDDPDVWRAEGTSPLRQAEIEIAEARAENVDLTQRRIELGDVLNFLTFDLACENSLRAQRRDPDAR